MRMHNPPHPGEIIKILCLEPLGVTVTQAAEALRVSRKTLSAILNGRAGVSPEMAVRLSIAFGTSAESWLSQQTQYDLWHAEQRRKQLRVAKLPALRERGLVHGKNLVSEWRWADGKVQRLPGFAGTGCARRGLESPA